MEWMLEQAQKFKSDDIYTARSWLLVAKSMFPHDFLVHVSRNVICNERSFRNALHDNTVQKLPCLPRVSQLRNHAIYF